MKPSIHRVPLFLYLKQDEELKKMQEEARNLQIERDHLLRNAQSSPFLPSGQNSSFSFSRQTSLSSQHSLSPNSSASKLPYVHGESIGPHTGELEKTTCSL